MPFDRLPAHDLNIPQVNYYVAPGRPIFPTNEVVQQAIAQITDALDPVKRAQRTLAMAQLPVQLKQIQLQKDYMDKYGMPYMNPAQLQAYKNAVLLGKIRGQKASAAPKEDPAAFHKMFNDAINPKTATELPVVPTTSMLNPTIGNIQADPFSTSGDAMQLQPPQS